MTEPIDSTDRSTADVDAAPPSVRLWSARSVGWASVLIGFPAGLGLAASNAWRLGRRPVAIGLLAFGVVAVFGVTTLPGNGRGVGLALGAAVGFLLYRLARLEEHRLAAAGLAIRRPGGISGLATIVASWVLLISPVVALSFVGGQVERMLAGTIEFGTGGSNCSVSGTRAQFAAADPIHLVAHLRREVRAGEVVHATVSTSDSASASRDLTVDQPADCISGDLRAGLAGDGVYTVEYAVGAEVLAEGRFTIGGGADGSSSAPAP